MKLRIGIAVVLAGGLATLAVPTASANYVYWPNLGGTTIGRMALDGSQLNNNFIKTNEAPNVEAPSAVAVDSHYVYWAHGSYPAGAIGRAIRADADFRAFVGFLMFHGEILRTRRAALFHAGCGRRRRRCCNVFGGRGRQSCPG